MEAATDLPLYVDTKTSAQKWYSFHILIGLASLLMAFVAIAFIEFEVAKLTHPHVSFIATPLWFDIVMSSLILILAVVNLSVLLFVFMRHLWIRRWMLATTFLGWILIAVMVIILNQRFLPILLPLYRQ